MNERPSPRAVRIVPLERAGADEDRRVAPRSILDVDVTIYAATGSAGREYIGVASDISRKGMFVSTFARVSVGARVTLKFRLPEGLVICDAEVKRVRTAVDGITGGLGLAFVNLSELDRSLVDRYCPPILHHSDVVPKQTR